MSENESSPKKTSQNISSESKKKSKDLPLQKNSLMDTRNILTIDKIMEAQVQASRDAIKGMRSQSVLGPGLDEKKWQLIRPLLKDAWDEVVLAGKSAQEFVALAIEALSPEGRPYFEKFVREDLTQPEAEVTTVSDFFLVSVGDDGRVWVATKPFSVVKGVDGVWRRSAPSPDDLKDNFERPDSIEFEKAFLKEANAAVESNPNLLRAPPQASK